MIVCQVCHAGDELEGLQWSIELKVSQSVRGFFKTQCLCQAICTQRTPKGPK